MKEIIASVSQQTEHLRVTKVQSDVMTVEESNRRLLRKSVGNLRRYCSIWTSH